MWRSGAACGATLVDGQTHRGNYSRKGNVAAAAGRFSLAGRVKLDYTSVGFAVGTRHRVLGCARGVEGTGSGVLGAVLTTAQLGQGSVQGA